MTIRPQQTRSVVAALALAAGVPLALSGCSGITDTLQHQTQGDYDTRDAVLTAWSTPAAQPDWIPEGSRHIQVIAATGGTSAADSPAVVRVRTSSGLPVGCTSIRRYSLDPYGVDWAPKKIPDTVMRCDGWAVVPTSNGWYAWTPLSADEAAE